MDTAPAAEAIFNHIDAAVQRMCGSASPPAVDGRDIGVDLPARRIAADELRTLLLDRSTSYATRDRALAAVADRARFEADPWLLVLTWLLLPGLGRMRARLLLAGADSATVEADLVAGVVSALHDRGPLPVQGVAACVCWHAYRSARQSLGLDSVRCVSVEAVTCPPVAPMSSSSGAAETALAAAVKRGVLTEADAEVVAATRLDCRRLDELASELQVRPETLQRRRARAEARLAAFLGAAVDAVIPCRGRLGARWARAVAEGDGWRRTALLYRPRPGGRIEAPRVLPARTLGTPWRPEVAA